MRLFVAVDIADETRAQLAAFRTRIERLLAAARRPPRVRWVEPSMAHVTLRFIGEVPSGIADDIDTALSGGRVDLPPFEVRWNTAGAFPRARAPRALWIGATAGGDALGVLAGAVQHRLAPVVGAGESRPFQPHLTVGRVKDAGAGFDWARALAEVQAGDSVSRVDHVTLYRSLTSPHGATYTAIGRYELGRR